MLVQYHSYTIAEVLVEVGVPFGRKLIRRALKESMHSGSKKKYFSSGQEGQEQKKRQSPKNDPRGQPTVMANTDHYFHTCCLLVLYTLAKTQLIMMFMTYHDISFNTYLLLRKWQV